MRSKTEIKSNKKIKVIQVYSMKNFQNILLYAAAEVGKDIIAKNPGIIEAIEAAKTEGDFEKISHEMLI